MHIENKYIKEEGKVFLVVDDDRYWCVEGAEDHSGVSFDINGVNYYINYNTAKLPNGKTSYGCTTNLILKEDDRLFPYPGIVDLQLDNRDFCYYEIFFLKYLRNIIERKIYYIKNYKVVLDYINKKIQTQQTLF